MSTKIPILLHPPFNADIKSKFLIKIIPYQLN